jgi:DNA-directed RNA polymerase specialized sigma24 family protein
MIPEDSDATGADDEEEGLDPEAEEEADPESHQGPWGGPSTPPFPIATDDSFCKFYKETVEQEVRRVRGKYPGAARDFLTAQGIVGDAYEVLYQKKESIEQNPLGKLRDEITNLVRKMDRRRAVSLDGPGFSGEIIPAESDAHSIASVVAALELRSLFSQEAVACLDKAQRLLYDLVADGMTLKEIAQRSGISYERTKSDWNKVYLELCLIMGRLASRMGDEKREPLRTRKAALSAIAGLPILLRRIVGHFFVENLPASQVALRLKMASEREVRMHLERAYEILENEYGEKMPEALVRALNHVHGNAGIMKKEDV